jgi:lysophospholipase L1-like esterase
MVNAACGGATIANVTTTGQYVEPPQAAQLSSGLRLVFVMIGGNDIGFGTLSGCIIIQTQCEQTSIPAASLQLVQQLGPKLEAAYAAIEAAAPHARVVVTLYPPLLPQDPNADLSHCPEINPAELRLGDQIQVALNRTIADRAHAHGFRVVDPGLLFAGHSVCAGTRSFFYRPPMPGTYHPNFAGRLVLAAADAAAVRT